MFVPSIQEKVPWSSSNSSVYARIGALDIGGSASGQPSIATASDDAGSELLPLSDPWQMAAGRRFGRRTAGRGHSAAGRGARGDQHAHGRGHCDAGRASRGAHHAPGDGLAAAGCAQPVSMGFDPWLVASPRAPPPPLERRSFWGRDGEFRLHRSAVAGDGRGIEQPRRSALRPPLGRAVSPQPSSASARVQAPLSLSPLLTRRLRRGTPVIAGDAWGRRGQDHCRRHRCKVWIGFGWDRSIPNPNRLLLLGAAAVGPPKAVEAQAQAPGATSGCPFPLRSAVDRNSFFLSLFLLTVYYLLVFHVLDPVNYCIFC